MQHLEREPEHHIELERMAAFDHESPTTLELAHLASCANCRSERAALSKLSTMALDTMNVSTNAPRLTNWESLSTRLRAEGLLVPTRVALHTTPSPVTSPTAVPVQIPARVSFAQRIPGWSRMAAAAVVFLAIGGMWGRQSAGAPVLPTALTGNSAATSSASFSLAGTEFGSLEDANRTLTRAQTDYERAALYLASHDTTVNSSEMVRRRLAALDQMVAASRAGLLSAPRDPVLTHYYSAAYTAREATLAQLGVVLPVNKSIERF